MKKASSRFDNRRKYQELYHHQHSDKIEVVEEDIEREQAVMVSQGGAGCGSWAKGREGLTKGQKNKWPPLFDGGSGGIYKKSSSGIVDID